MLFTNVVRSCMEDHVLLFHQVTSLRSKYGVIFEDILQTDSFLHKYLHVEVAFDDQPSEITFLKTLLEYIFLNCVDRYQSINVNGLCLSYTMAPILSLLVHSRVPISVIEDNAVGACQVDADTATSGGGDEAEDLLVQVEPVYEALPHFHLH